MVAQIAEFYTERVLDRLTITGPNQVLADVYGAMRAQNRTRFVTRVEFLYGAAFAIAKLIQTTIFSAFFLIATLATAFQNEFCRRGLFENASLIPIYLGAIPVGFMGAVIPPYDQPVAPRQCSWPLEAIYRTR